MGAKSERSKNKRIKLIGGGYRYTRQPNTKAKGGSLKSKRRALRRNAKDKKATPESRRAAKNLLRDMLVAKNTRKR